MTAQTHDISSALFSHMQHYIQQLSQPCSQDMIQHLLAEICVEQNLKFLDLLLIQPTSIMRANAAILTHPQQKNQVKILKELAKSLVFRKLFKHQIPLYWQQSDLTQYPKSELCISISPHLKHRGMSIPIYTQSFAWGILSFQLNNHIPSAHLLNIAPNMSFLARYLYQAAYKILEYSPKWLEKKPTLSTREKECLYWVSEGKTSWEIALILGISERTVNFHLAQLHHKLGARNRHQGLAKVLVTSLMVPCCKQIVEIKTPITYKKNRNTNYTG